MIQYSNLLLLVHLVHEKIWRAADWLSDMFAQVGLGVIIWVGYVRYWVS